LRSLTANSILTAPSFAWAEFGSVLRKKLRQGLSEEIAKQTWHEFNALSIEYVESSGLRLRAWDIASRFSLPTLYDACFLACAELAVTSPYDHVELWTTDALLIKQLGPDCPVYVQLFELP
jgi:predicted nucleic acid-binding protein